MARKKTKIQEEAQPANVTPLPKRRARERAPIAAVATTTTGSASLVPTDPIQRYAWDRMWDMLIAKAMPHVIAYIQERDAERNKAA
jgi:hypothetical protein